MEFRTRYKCRRCGEIFPFHVTMNRKIAIKAICSCITRSAFKDGIQPGIYEIHSCKDGNIGVADFIGVRQEKAE